MSGATFKKVTSAKRKFSGIAERANKCTAVSADNNMAATGLILTFSIVNLLTDTVSIVYILAVLLL